MTRTLSGSPQPTPPAPDWEILLSHHGPERYNRTFCLPILAGRIHLCARCTGQVLGVLGFVILYWVSLLRSAPIFQLKPQLPFAILPLFATVDWLLQTGAQRESSNARRLFSG